MVIDGVNIYTKRRARTIKRDTRVFGAEVYNYIILGCRNKREMCAFNISRCISMDERKVEFTPENSVIVTAAGHMNRITRITVWWTVSQLRAQCGATKRLVEYMIKRSEGFCILL